MRLKLQDQSQALVDSTLQTRRQHTGLLAQEASVKRENLGNIHNRIAWKSRRPCW
jgi:hypothetical protein